MKIRSCAFTLIELLAVIFITSIIATLMLTALSAARKRALRRSMNPVVPAQGFVPARPALEQPATGQRPSAVVKSFGAEVSLKPDLSVGTAEPESIYSARISAKFSAFNLGKEGECEIQLPLPPQIISLADLEVTVNSQRSESVEMRGDKLVWSGVLPAQLTPVTIAYSAVGKGIYNLQLPPGGVLDTFHMGLTAVGSDVRMLELSLQPTRHVRANGQTVYTWDYKNLLFGRPIALDVLGIAPVDRLGELSWLGPSSVVLFGLVLGLMAHAYRVKNYDRWMLLLVLGMFTSAYPLMYFAQEFIPLNIAVPAASILVLMVIALRSATIMSLRLAVLGTVLPAAVILSVTLAAALHPRLQGILITAVGMALFTVAMVLLPRLKRERPLPLAPQGAGA